MSADEVALIEAAMAKPAPLDVAATPAEAALIQVFRERTPEGRKELLSIIAQIAQSQERPPPERPLEKGSDDVGAAAHRLVVQMRSDLDSAPDPISRSEVNRMLTYLEAVLAKD